MTLANLLAPTYAQLLKALSQWLDKAQAQMPDGGADALLSARLAPDMYPLATQIRFACVQAQEGLYRLKGEAFPPGLETLLNEGRNAGEHPGTIADAQARIAETIAVVDAMGSFETDPESAVEHALPIGMIFDLTAEQYARDWAIPQFYFHLMTAYAILRNQGVELGKADFVAHMFPFIRPGTMAPPRPTP